MDGIKWIGSPNHYNGRLGYKVTRITLHIMAGYLTGTDSLFQNPNRQASSTYGIGPNGEIHQYVAESDAPWTDPAHAGQTPSVSSIRAEWTSYPVLRLATTLRRDCARTSPADTAGRNSYTV